MGDKVVLFLVDEDIVVINAQIIAMGDGTGTVDA